MPELPDLVCIARKLGPQLEGRTITEVTVKQPIVIRMLCQGSFQEALVGKTFGGVARHGQLRKSYPHARQGSSIGTRVF